jgi:hypothetical protein
MAIVVGAKALVDVCAGVPAASESGGALASMATKRVPAVRRRVARVVADETFVNVIADLAVAHQSWSTFASEAASSVDAVVDARAVVRSLLAFVDLGARGARGQVACLARALTILQMRDVHWAGSALILQ